MAALIFDCLLVFFRLCFFHVTVCCKKKNAAQFNTNNVRLQHVWIPNCMYVFFLHIYTDLYNYVYLYCPLSVLEELQHSCLTPSVTYQLRKLESYYCRADTHCPSVSLSARQNIYLFHMINLKFTKKM